MIILTLFLLLFAPLQLSGTAYDLITDFDQLVVGNTQIQLHDYPHAHNPSLIKTEHGLLLVFRYIPDWSQSWISYIGVVFLNESFKPISRPQLLHTRTAKSKTPSQSEDARIFSYQGNLYLIFNDNIDVIHPSRIDRRDMFIAKLTYANGQFSLSTPLKLIHKKKYLETFWQKNWSPFVWQDQILISYLFSPHEIIKPDMGSGSCLPIHTTNPPMKWKWGQMKGGTPAQLVDGEYLAFFHSWCYMTSHATQDKEAVHYYMGAYTFSPNPPFAITKMTPYPITTHGIYDETKFEKKVVFPGGFVVSDPYIHVAYGRDDGEIWIATLNKNLLKKVLIPLGK